MPALWRSICTKVRFICYISHTQISIILFFPSDLLSRHVNKCHANEKPPPNAGNARRKGSDSASRATTSKQACDQCVQSSLPCDGCNPCGNYVDISSPSPSLNFISAKCVQRKCRCTFVKFHRQTAPAGPGHNPRPSSSASRLPVYPQADDFILGPAPRGVPSMADNLYSQTFAFPPGFQPPADSSSLSLPDQTSTDFAAKYRAQAELLRRAGGAMGHGVPPAQGAAGSTGVGHGLYSDPQATSSWLGWSQDASEPNFSAAHGGLDLTNTVALAARYLQHDEPKHIPVDKDFQAALSRHFMDQADPQYPGPPSRAQPAGYPMPGAGDDVYPNGSISYAHARVRRGSHDLSSEGSTTSHPSSAASSSVHLPLDLSSVHQPQMTYHVRPRNTANSTD